MPRTGKKCDSWKGKQKHPEMIADRQGKTASLTMYNYLKKNRNIMKEMDDKNKN